MNDLNAVSTIGRTIALWLMNERDRNEGNYVDSSNGLENVSLDGYFNFLNLIEMLDQELTIKQKPPCAE